MALIGIFALEVFKYWGVFNRISEGGKHFAYIFVSIVFTIIISVIYIACEQIMTLGYFLSVALMVFAMNQMFYNLLKVTWVVALFRTILDFIGGKFAQKAEPKE